MTRGGAEYGVLQRRPHACVVVCIKLPKRLRHNENQHHAASHLRTRSGAHNGQWGADLLVHSVVAKWSGLKYHFKEMRPDH